MPASDEPMTRTFSSSAGARLASTSIPAASSGWGTQRVVAEPAVALGRHDRQAEDALDERAVVERPDPGAADAAAGQDEGVGADPQRARGRLGVDRRRPAGRSARRRPRRSRSGSARPDARIRRRSASNSRRPGTDGGRLAISKTRWPSATSASACTSAWSIEPEDRRHADPPRAGGDGRGDRRQRARPPGRVLEEARQHLRGDVVEPIEPGKLDLDRADLGWAAGPRGVREVAGRVRAPTRRGSG